ncbi:MAG: hypothetical protein JXA67_06820, partial [Micromonosporaceae bacterium]|nr:hypothetical protein [Micromonosporaceae bacterium]
PQQVFDTALQQYNDAKGRLDASVQRQTQLDADVKATQLQLDLLYAAVGGIAAAAYRGSQMSTTTILLESDSPDAFLDGLTMLRYVTGRDDKAIGQLKATRQTLDEQKRQLDEETKLQQQQLTVMKKQLKTAEAALKQTGGGQASTGVASGSASAEPAPRNADGSWPKETCSVDDPTTGSCLTPRTLHAYQAARKAGYTRYTKCFRQSSTGEHAKGRACDFSSATSTFRDAKATGSDKTYGDKLAGWLVANASRLGVLYVIWYKQIWYTGQGWRSYSGDGTPSGDHYNHVHLSMQ